MAKAKIADNLQVAAGGNDSPPTRLLTEADVRAIVASILEDRLPPVAGDRKLIDFTELAHRIPLSPRSLRAGIKKGWLPFIRFPGARRLLFDWEVVRTALRRFEKGGFE